MDPLDPRSEPLKRRHGAVVSRSATGGLARIYVPNSEPHCHTKDAFWLIGP
jgi:hypothetical protein